MSTFFYNLITPEIIEYAATLSKDKVQPMQYMNKILSNWFEQKITTLEQAKLAGDLFKVGAGVEGKQDKKIGRASCRERV